MELRRCRAVLAAGQLEGDSKLQCPFSLSSLCQALGVYFPLLEGCIYVAYRGGLRDRERGNEWTSSSKGG